MLMMMMAVMMLLHSHDPHQLVRDWDDDDDGDDGADDDGDGVDRDGIDNGAHVQLQTLAPIMR